MKEFLKALVSKKGLIIEGSIAAAAVVGVAVKKAIDKRRSLEDAEEEIVNDSNED